MNILKNIKSFFTKKENFLLFSILLVGFVVRLYSLDSLPIGLNQDEAFSGYEAYSLLTYGTDSFGYKNPVYLTAWGSGMNAFGSYIAAFSFLIFGVSAASLRFPQALLSCISLIVFYLLLKEIFNKKTALIGTFLLAISPWHIMAARWALESNFNIYFLLFGLYFFIKGIKSKNNIHWIFASFMYGISLYTYAISYMVVPLTLGLFVLYILISKTKFNLKTALISTFILFVMALPLILFLLVNEGYINEITTSFISIPKLIGYRVSEVSLSNLFSLTSYYNLYVIIFRQTDGLIWNSTSYGMFYLISSPLIVIGFIKILFNILKDIKNKVFSYNLLILLGFIASIFISILISWQNINKVNCIHIFTLIFITLGAEFILSLLNKKFIYIAFSLIYLFNFANFINYYSTDYNNEISNVFRAGVYEATQFVNEEDFNLIVVDTSIFYPQILFADKTDIYEYQESVVYTNYPSSFLSVSSFTKYKFGIDFNNLIENCYMTHKDNANLFLEKGYNIEYFHNYLVAYK